MRTLLIAGALAVLLIWLFTPEWQGVMPGFGAR